MARAARLVVPGLPHLVCQKAAGRPLFAESADYQAYRNALAVAARAAGLEVLAYCLLPLAVQAVVIPAEPNALARGFGAALRATALERRRRLGAWAPLVAGRFGSAVLAPEFVAAAFRLVLFAPARTGDRPRAREWPWSNLASLLRGEADQLADTAAALRLWPAAAQLKEESGSYRTYERLRLATRTGRPAGDAAFLRELEARTGRNLAPGKRGRPGLAATAATVA